MKLFPIIIITILLACKGKTTDRTELDLQITDTVEKRAEEDISSLIGEIDNSNKSVNEVFSDSPETFELNLQQLTNKEFDSLLEIATQNAIPLQSYNEFVIDMDSCLVLKLTQVESDTLCNIVRDEYYQNFEIRGLWERKGQLLMHFENWEESYEYLINIKTGEQFLLSQDYQVSPNGNFIVDFTNEIQNPLYSNSFILAQFSSNGYIHLIDIDSLVVTNAVWLSDMEILIEAGSIDIEDWKIVNETKYLLGLHN